MFKFTVWWHWVLVLRRVYTPRCAVHPSAEPHNSRIPTTATPAAHSLTTHRPQCRHLAQLGCWMVFEGSRWSSHRVWNYTGDKGNSSVLSR